MNEQMNSMAAMLAATIAIASELGGEITRLHGNLGWTESMQERLKTMIRNGLPQATATPDDEKRFYDAGHAALALVMAGVRVEAEKDGLV
ncbi:hypothetical protein [Bosea sp. MMO-172]|uniref:hypothetical protein n=1 Tax=Bosea sp. MMO-172 TaxID=3127885 RepID=UPI003017FA46